MTISTRKSLILLAVLGIVSGCATGATGSDIMAASSASRSAGTVWGSVSAGYMRDDCFKGTPVALIPVTEEVISKVVAVFGNDQAGSVVSTPSEMSEGGQAETSLVPTARIDRCTYGSFRFENVPAGDYFVTTTVNLPARQPTSELPPSGAASIALMKRIAVAADQSVRVSLKHD